MTNVHSLLGIKDAEAGSSASEFSVGPDEKGNATFCSALETLLTENGGTL